MSGAPGHIRHLHEDGNLTFGDLKQVLRQAATGDLKQVTEKLDGINLVFTWDLLASAGSGLRVARSIGDIKHGGMGAKELAQKFNGRPTVEQAFSSAFKVLKDAINVLPTSLKFAAFGPSGQVWYSIEVVYAVDPNVISYDTNAIVFHGWPVFEERLGTVIQRDAPDVIEKLSQRIDQMQKAVSLKDWRICGPALVNLKKLTDGTALNEALFQISSAQSLAGIGDDHTLNDYVAKCIENDPRIQELPTKLLAPVVSRIVGLKGAPTLHDMRKLVHQTQYYKVNDLVKQGPEMVKAAMAPIERVIMDFSIQVLKGIQSTLVNNVDVEVARIKAHVKAALAAIQNSNNTDALDFATTQMHRLESLDNINTAIEGIVFLYKGNAYKFTGSFAPVNQILALCKYGRKGMPPITMDGK